jgi:phosphinothricin acetyltransferase
VTVRIRPARASDANAICGIYNHYIAHTVITFEQDLVAPEAMAQRIVETMASYPWLVCEDDAGLAAYAYGTRWRSRAAYDCTVESTVYVHRERIGQGYGLGLYRELIAALRARRMHAVVGCIALPNPASVALHERCGFRQVGHFPEAGRKFGRWVDVGFWQLVL